MFVFSSRQRETIRTLATQRYEVVSVDTEARQVALVRDCGPGVIEELVYVNNNGMASEPVRDAAY